MKRALLAGGIILALVAAGLVYGSSRPPPTVASVGPLQLSNSRVTAVTVYGSNLPWDGRIRFGGVELETIESSRRHLRAFAPPHALPPGVVRGRVKVEALDRRGRVIGGGELTVVNDAAFPTPTAVAARGGHTAVVSPSTDELWIDGALRPSPGDGPRDVAAIAGGFVVVLEEEGALAIVPTSTGATRRIPVFGRPQAVAVDEARRVAYVSELAREQLIELELDTGRVLRELDVDANPGALALDGRTLWLSSWGADTISWLDLDAARPVPVELVIGPGAEIVGGPTEPLSAYVMSGKAARAFAVGERSIFAATVGPNVGPNPARFGVSTNGGVTVIDKATRRFVRHVAIDGGLPQGLALAGDTLFVADVSRGRVHALDVRALESGEARAAERASFAVEVPPELPRLRPEAPDAVHAGPWALAVDGDALHVLSRFKRTLDAHAVADLSRRSRVVLGGPETQPLRRQGEILYHVTLGPYRLSCDGCHPDGRDGGTMYTKPELTRIYRSPNIRTAHDSAPYFTPRRFPNMRVIAAHLMAQFRPPELKPTTAEVNAISEYVLAMTAPASPFVNQPRVVLADGWSGSPFEGQRIFMGRGKCAERCHPPPHFTSDQAEATRGVLYDVGTGAPLPLRPELQAAMTPERAPPSLVGVWDAHPLFLGATAGVRVEGARLVPSSRFALREVLSRSARHGGIDALSDEDLDDLLAYLMTL